MAYTSLQITCPHCKEKVKVEVEVDSPSDYYFDSDCPECGLNIDKLDQKVYNEIVDYYAGKADYYRDTMMDR